MAPVSAIAGWWPTVIGRKSAFPLEIHPFDNGGRSEDLSLEGERQPVCQPREKSHALFGLAVRVNDRFFDERLEPMFSERLGDRPPIR
jgi:hypothetical protein